jgi:outer membrane protein assembly factor BamB
VAGSQDGTLVGIDPRSGALRWVIPALRVRLDGRDMGAQDFRPVARAADTLVAGSLTGQVVAYDLGTRQQRWRVAPVAASVAFGLAADRTVVYVPYLSGDLVALDMRDGSERWRTGAGRRFRLDTARARSPVAHRGIARRIRGLDSMSVRVSA